MGVQQSNPRRSSPIWLLSRDDFQRLVVGSRTQTEVLAHFGLKNKGNNWATLKRRIAEDGIDASHLGRQRYSFPSRRTPLADVLVRESTFNRTHLKRRLLQEGVLRNGCLVCGLGPEWEGQRLVLVLDHINGVADDHRLSNLRLVCPNCASQLPTHAGRKNQGRTSKRPRSCFYCGTPTKYSDKCWLCACREGRKVKRPSLKTLRREVQELGFVGTGRKYGVSDNAVRKWLK